MNQLFGRVLMVAPPDDWWQRDLAWIEDLQPAGIILFKRHLSPGFDVARQAVKRLEAWARARGERLLVAMDEEGGFVTQSSAFFPTPPSARALAWGGNAAKTREIFTRYGRRLRTLGLNVDFAPVVDINNNPENPVIGARAFGADVETVVEHARAVCDGLKACGIAPTLKHFPGHGDTDQDSHLTLPVVQHDRSRFDAIELAPFVALLQEVPLVMVAHLACPQMGDGLTPATLSFDLTTKILREELGFEGVAITDSMEMKAVADQLSYSESAVQALNAGCDLLLYCFELTHALEARQGLASALSSGSLSEQRLHEAAGRVDRLRQATAEAIKVDPGDLPDPAEDLECYRSVSRNAINVYGETPWQPLQQAVKAGEVLHLAGRDEEIVGNLAERLSCLGARTVQIEFETAARQTCKNLIVILSERRSLDAAAAEEHERLARQNPRAILFNLRTPEIDSAIEKYYVTHVQTADASDAMLDVLAHSCCRG